MYFNNIVNIPLDVNRSVVKDLLTGIRVPLAIIPLSMRENNRHQIIKRIIIESEDFIVRDSNWPCDFER